MPLISIVTPCFNEELNIQIIYEKVKSVFNTIEGYQYEHIFIDNSSKDKTVDILRNIASADKNVKVIVNNRNFGVVRSPYYALLQARGDAAITMVADLQDPPDLIPEFIKKWEQGNKVVMGIKNQSEENGLIYRLRCLYYFTLRKLADIQLVDNFTGFGLFDKQVIETLRKIDDPYPYGRGLIADLGYRFDKVNYIQPKRKKGKSKNNFYTLFDIAMLGLTNYSKVPLRLATMIGFSFSVISFLIGLFYLFYKIIFWQDFSLGLAPLVIGIFFFGSIQLFFLGIVGEYVGAIYTQVQKRPLVIERERINF